jgi:amino acid transporter
VFAVFVCALAVHAGTVRLIFAMARDDNLPFAQALGRVPRRTQAPALPALLVGLLAAGLLVFHINLPQIVETLSSLAILWVNLAYLMVTLPMLAGRILGRSKPAVPGPGREGLFSMGRLGLPVNAVASAWGLFVVLNIAWPRPEFYGTDPWGRFAAPLWTLGLLVAGLRYYGIVQRRRVGGTLAEHRAGPIGEGDGPTGASPEIEGPWIGRLAASE